MTDIRITMGASEVFILRALLSEGADSAHTASAITALVITAMGGDVLDEVKRNAAKAAIANGASSLRQRGCMVSEGRAWRITESGVRVARNEIPLPKIPAGDGLKVRVNSPRKDQKPTQAPTAPSAPETTVQRLADSPPAPDPVPSVNVPATPRLPSPQVVPSTERVVDLAAQVQVPRTSLVNWPNDPVLRGLVTTNLRCFGGWHSTDPECGACVLAVHCRQAQGKSMGILAQQISADEVLETTKALHTAMGTAISKSLPRTRAELIPGHPMIASNDGVCCRSGPAYKKGDQVIYYENEGVGRADARQ